MSRATIRPALITRVLPGSIGEELGLEPGDQLVTINGVAPRDLIDYQFAIAEEVLELLVQDAQGQLHEVELEKEVDADLGLEFSTALFDGLIQCNNACPFCFIDQQPPETRATLHLKDDDYRLSFLYGSYLTLTNLPAAEWERIAQFRLSPLYVSVHATEPEVRASLLKNPRAGQILEQLDWFRRQRLQIHAQVVVCPGWNDGAHLERTLRDLAEFYPPLSDPSSEDPELPTVLSAAVVPVGLTRFRPSSDPLVPVSPAQAAEIIDQVEALQAEFRQSRGTSLAWLADEWYLIAHRSLPPASHYEDYPQIGNGVGSLRQFLSDFAAQPLPERLDHPVRLIWVVGNAVEEAFQPILQRLQQIENLNLHLCAIASQYWGQAMTVTGLLTGQDILAALQQSPPADAILLPTVTLKDGEAFLDDLSWRDLEAKTGMSVIRVSGGAAGLVEAIQQSPSLVLIRR